jgi:hypothetical protein
VFKRRGAEEELTVGDLKFFMLLAFLFFLVDTYVYLQGHNTFFWAHKTPAELEYQRKALGLDVDTSSPPLPSPRLSVEKKVSK